MRSPYPDYFEKQLNLAVHVKFTLLTKPISLSYKLVSPNPYINIHVYFWLTVVEIFAMH